MTGGSGAIAARSRGLRGPSALGGGWRQFWDLLIINSTTGFRNRYVNTVFGFLWMFIGPLLFFAVLYVFVTQIIERFNEIPHYGELLLFNVMLFNLYRTGSSQGMRSLVGSANLLRKMPVPRVVLPLAAVLTNVYVLAATMVIVFAWILIAGIDPMWTWFLLPVIVLAMIAITAGAAILLAGAYVRFRDIGQVWPIAVQVSFYASPVIWPFGFIRDEILWEAQTFNPMAPVFAQARVWIIDPSAPTWFEGRGTGFDAFVPFIVFGLLSVAAVIVFRREARRAAEDA